MVGHDVQEVREGVDVLFVLCMFFVLFALASAPWWRMRQHIYNPTQLPQGQARAEGESVLAPYFERVAPIR